MASVKELLENDAALEQAAEKVAECANMEAEAEDSMNTGVESAAELGDIMDNVASDPAKDYVRFCGMGKGDF